MSGAYLRFWGVRGSYPAPFDSHLRTGGNTSCVELRVGDHVVVLDAGTGIVPLGNALLEQKRIQELSVFLTHYHWDHISGLPFFVPAFTPGWRIRFYGPGSSPAAVEASLSEQMKAPYFPVETETWLADIEYPEADEQGITCGPFAVKHFNVHHPGSTYGYCIEVLGKRIVYASDNELAFIDGTIERRREEFDASEQHLLEDMREEHHRHALEFMRDVDILIHDAQYTPEDYARKRGWGHSCYLDTVRCAIEAGVRSLYLFHLDPNYDDRAVEELHRSCLREIERRHSSLQCYVAREGVAVRLDGGATGGEAGARSA